MGDSAVAEAFSKYREIEFAEEVKQKQMLDAAKATQKALMVCRRQTEEANQLLKKRKAELLNMDRLLEAKHSIENVSLASMGEGKRNSGGVAGRKVRYHVLDRLANLGAGLSPAQRNDFVWFKESWDDRMVDEHHEQWARLFAQWMAKVVEDIEDGSLNAFSLFVNRETRRCLSTVPLLSIPAG